MGRQAGQGEGCCEERRDREGQAEKGGEGDPEEEEIC